MGYFTGIGYGFQRKSKVVSPTSGSFGYFVGGQTSTGATAVTTNDALDFTSDTTAMVTKGVLSQARSFISGGNSTTLGYFAGGLTNNSGPVTTTDGLTFSANTTAMVTKGALAASRQATGCTNSSTLAYWAGGLTANAGGAQTSTSSGLTFATDTTLQVTKGALTDSVDECNGANSSTIGYFAGGMSTNDAVQSVTNGLDFSSDTTAMVTKGALSVVKTGTGAVNSSTLAYWAGGYTASGATGANTQCDGLTFASDTTAMVTKGAMTTQRSGLAGANSSTIGYFAGGRTAGGATQTSVCDGLTFASDTVAQVTKGSLTTARHGVGSAEGTV